MAQRRKDHTALRPHSLGVPHARLMGCQRCSQTFAHMGMHARSAMAETTPKTTPKAPAVRHGTACCVRGSGGSIGKEGGSQGRVERRVEGW